MPRLPFVRHRAVNQIGPTFRACRRPVEKARWHAIWLLARTDVGRTPAHVADRVGWSAVTVRDVRRRWNVEGPAGRTGRRKGNGSDPRLTARQRAALYAALRKRPPDGGLWAGPKVVRYVADRWSVTVGPVTGRRWLRDLGSALRVPRPSRPRSADRPTRRRWKKTYAAG